MTNVCKALNVLGDSPWKINRQVLKVVEQVYENGGGHGEIPIVDEGTQFITEELD